MAAKLEDVIAGNLHSLRTERGWTQSELAARMRGAGLSNWQQNRVTQIETFRRPAVLLEVIILSWVFGVPMARFFQGADDVELPGGETVPLQSLQAVVAGDVPDVRTLPRPGSGFAADELRRIAKQLALPVHVLDWLARSMYSRPFIEERDARVGDTAGLPKRSVQTKRGNATRVMTGELAGFIRAQGGPERVWQSYLLATGPRPASAVDLSIPDAAKLMNASTENVQRFVAAGTLLATSSAEGPRIPESAVQDWLRAGTSEEAAGGEDAAPAAVEGEPGGKHLP